MTKKTNIWDDDLLGRERDSAYLYSLIKNRSQKQKSEGSVVVNIDARWGQGKSFFLHNMCRQVLAEGHPAISINAWKYDYVDDPYTYVMAELDAYFQSLVERQEKSLKDKIADKVDAVRNNAGKLLWLGIKGIGKRASRYAFGAAADEMVEVVDRYAPSVKAEATEIVDDVEKQLVEVTDNIISAYIKKRLDDFTETKEALQSFRDNLASLIEILEKDLGMKMPMFIFIDELDRCRPTYAVQMLERIKHLFDVPQMAFIIATDTTSLSHSIQAVYGPKFDGREYLGRFFNRTYKLPEASRKRIISAMIMVDGIDLNRWRYPAYNTTLETYSEFIELTSRKFDLSIRQVEQSLRILFDITFAHNERFTLEIIYLYTLICYFIKNGSLDNNDWPEISALIINFGEDWSVELSTGRAGFFEFIQRVRKISESSVNDAMIDLSDIIRTVGDAEATHFYEAIKVEYKANGGKFRTKNTDYAAYFDLINHAKNSYIDDQVGVDQ